MRALLFKGPSNYGVTQLFIDHAAQALRARGYETEIVEFGGPDEAGRVLSALVDGGRGADLLFNFNILGEARDARGRTLGQMFDCPHVIWHVDYPLWQHTLAKTAPETRLFVVDPTHVAAIHGIYGADRFPHAAFGPHAAIGEAAEDDADADAFVARRPVPLLWTGGLPKLDPAPAWHAFAGQARQLFQRAYDQASAEEWLPTLDAVDDAFRSFKLEPSDPKFAESRRNGATLVDRRIRDERRLRFIKTLAKTGLPLQIAGSGWEKHLYRFKNADYLGVVSLAQTADLAKRARVSLNVNPHFGAGSHERPLSALLSGCAVFSDHTDFYARELGADEGATLYRWKTLDDDMQRLVQLVKDPELAFRRARVGKAKVIAGHTWDSRIQLALDAAGLPARVA